MSWLPFVFRRLRQYIWDNTRYFVFSTKYTKHNSPISPNAFHHARGATFHRTFVLAARPQIFGGNLPPHANRPFAKDQRLVVQINDSSESVMANMAEGFGRGTQEEFIIFLGYAIGSLDETQSHLCAAYDREYIAKDLFVRLYREGTEIRKLTVGFIRAMILPRAGVRHLGKRPDWSSRVWEIYERVTGQQRPPMFNRPADNGQPEPRNDQPLL